MYLPDAATSGDINIGDIIVVTYDKNDYESLNLEIQPLDSELVGPYIVCSEKVNDDFVNGNNSISGVTSGYYPYQVQKLTFPDANIHTVNGISADGKGNVELYLDHIAVNSDGIKLDWEYDDEHLVIKITM